MMRAFSGALAVIAGVGLALSAIACGDSGAAGTGTGSAGSGGPSATASATGVGVAECDAYLVRMRACIAGAPETERSAREQSINDIEKAWRGQEGAEAKGRLVTPCKKMIEQLDADGVCK